MNKEKNENNKNNEKLYGKNKETNLHNNQEQTAYNNEIKGTKHDKIRDEGKIILLLKGEKGHTGKWKGLDKHYKNLMPFLISDRASAEKALANALQHFNIKEATTNRDEWVRIFNDSYTNKSRKSKMIKTFGVKLAASDPKGFFLPHEFNGEKLLRGNWTNAWAGAYTFYGPGWLPEIVVCLDISTGISKPTLNGGSIWDQTLRRISKLLVQMKFSPIMKARCMIWNDNFD
jgi:hypothetical protein